MADRTGRGSSGRGADTCAEILGRNGKKRAKPRRREPVGRNRRRSFTRPSSWMREPGSGMYPPAAICGLLSQMRFASTG